MTPLPLQQDVLPTGAFSGASSEGEPGRSPRSTRTVFSILALSFVLSLGYSFYHRIEPVVDARAYDTIAVNILNREGFREKTDVPLAYDPVIVRAGPLYEYFLAAVYAVFGHRLEAVWVIQALLHAATALLLYSISFIAFGRDRNAHRAGIAAMALFAFHPDLIEIAAMLMTETLYLFLVTVVLFFFVRAFEQSQNLFLAASLGLSTGLAVLIRPPVALFMPVILVFYLLRRHVRSALLFSALFIAVLLPWVVRNLTLYQQFIPTTLIGEYNLWVGNTLHGTGGQIAGDPNPALLYAAEEGYLGFKDEARQEFMSFAMEHPLVFAKLTLLRAVRYFSLIRPMGFWFYQSGVPQLVFVVLSLVSIAALFLFGFSGLWEALKKRTPLLRYLGVFALLAPLPLLIATVESRYRFQLYPLLAVFAGYFLADFWVTRTARPRTFLAVLAALGVVTLFDLYSFWPMVVSRLLALFS